MQKSTVTSFVLAFEDDTAALGFFAVGQFAVGIVRRKKNLTEPI